MHNLEFRGRWIDIFGNVLLISILSIITLGIYAPWGYARYQRVVATRTYYQDQSLQFDGTGGQAFVEFLIIAALTIVTLGLYGILGFASTRLLRWQYAHTILPTGQRLEYEGDAIDLFFENFLLVLFSMLTLGIYYFWGYARVRRYIVTHTYLDGKSLQFEGTGGQYFVIALVNTLLTIITLGFYALLGFATVRLLRWDARNTSVPLPERAVRPLPVHSPVAAGAFREAPGERLRPSESPVVQAATPPRYEEPVEQLYSRPNYAYSEPNDRNASEEDSSAPRAGEQRHSDQSRQRYREQYNDLDDRRTS
jgi:uncharacterized membrane protein YjgN (DUF898 family)